MSVRGLALVTMAVFTCEVSIATPAVPSADELKRIIARDFPGPEMYRTGCLSVTLLGERADDFDFSGQNPYKSFATFSQDPASREPPRPGFRELRALARAGVLSEEPASGPQGRDGMRGVTFKVTDLGWTHIRPGNGLCMDFGTHDYFTITNVEETPATPEGRQLSIAYQTGFTGRESLAPWARDPSIMNDIPLLKSYVTQGHKSILHGIEDHNKGWRLVHAVVVRRAPELSGTQVLELARTSISELQSPDACFPLPVSRPQLGVAVSGGGAEYTVKIEAVERLNSTQRAFRSSFSEQLTDYARAGLLVEVGPQSYRLNPKLRGNVRGHCLLLGSLTPRVVRSGLYQWYNYDAFFKIRAEVHLSASVTSSFPEIARQRDVRQFVSRGLACEGWMRFGQRDGWRIETQKCYPAY
jgi:hypothetical protein